MRICVMALGIALLGAQACNESGTADTADSESGGNADSDADTDADSDVDSDADSDMDADTDSDGDVDSGSGSGSDSDTDADTGGDSDTDTASDLDTATDSGPLDTAVPEVECETVQDCVLVDNCCDCKAIPATDPPPVCDNAMCFVNQCMPMGITEKDVACVLGRCVLDRSCDDRNVTCKMAEPVCPEGQEPAVTQDGSCWSTTCVPVEECTAVPACDSCAKGQRCVMYELQMAPVYHCVDYGDACRDGADCGCLGPSVCLQPFGLCTSGDTQINCGCPNC